MKGRKLFSPCDSFAFPVFFAVFFFFLTPLNSSAQRAFPVYGDSVVWKIWESEFWLGRWNTEVRLVGDTLMCGFTYSKVFLPPGVFTVFPRGYFRNDGQKTFFRQGPGCGYPEFVIYDWSQQPGDTLWVPSPYPYQNDPPVWLKVDSINLRNYFGINRRVFFYSSSFFYFDQRQFIEGFGSTVHPFWPMRFFGTEEDYILTCVDSAGSQKYQNDNPLITNCQILLGQAENLEKKLDLKVAPNPFGERIQAESTLKTPQIVKAELFDVSGKLVSEINSGSVSGRNVFFFEPKVAGVYLLRIQAGNLQITRKVMKSF